MRALELIICATASVSCAEDTMALERPDASAPDAMIVDASVADAGELDASAPEVCHGVTCALDERCNVWTRRCQPKTDPYPPAGEDNGGQCTTEADCRSNGSAVPGHALCVTTNGADYCVSYCDLPADFGVPDTFVRSDCPAGSVCFATSEGSNDQGIGSCVKECHDDSECRTADGYYCRRTYPFNGRTYTNGYCAPAHCVSRGCFGYECSC